MKTLCSVSALIVLFVVSVHAQQPADFALLSATDGSTFVLSEAKGKYVALHFLLKTECPYCLRHTHEYLSKSDSLPGVIQVFIKPDEEGEIEEWAEKLSERQPTRIPVYRDPDAQLAELFDIPDGYFFHGQSMHYPALILLDPDGKEIFRYVGKNNRDRYPFERLAEKVRELSASHNISPP
ncbi:MAG: peroxiredoxin family protein [Bacteroidota bacterium]